MENNNGKGLFYGVIGVATLIVAIIGATFAYFTASATNTGGITGNTASAGGLTLSVEELITPSTATNLIPLNIKTGDTVGVDVTNQFSNAMDGKCKDSNGSNVCTIYKIIVSNTSTTNSIMVSGALELTSAANMKWQLLTFADGETVNAANVTMTANSGINPTGDEYVITIGDANDTNLPVTLSSTAVPGTATKTYYVLVWLEETGSSQETADANKTYTGEVTFNATDSAGNNSGVTATFTAAAAEPEEP